MTEWTDGYAAIAPVVAAILDFWVGDPWNWPHPVQGMGWLIRRYTDWVFKANKSVTESAIAMKLAGVLLTVILVVGSGALGWGLVTLARRIDPWLGVGLDAILLASCLAGRSLRDAAEDVLVPVMQGDLPEARDRLSRYVGRDTQDLERSEVLRAVFETVAENAVDGVMGPLFYGLIGAATPLGSASLALAYKAASTLDSMVGYREAPYTHLGWSSAKLEDGLTWLPCRLTVLTLALLSRHPRRVIQLCQRDAAADPSPNSGWSECAYAASLGVRVGGKNVYRGVVKVKPLMGDSLRPITPEVVREALTLDRICFLLWLSVGVVLLLTLGTATT
ncbi:adenosylcobinamide-phosphate synthase CbiB [Baaleninema simplex]|uniref:adenosylcobinamide-phosphate synthase CbiB n=1 Tax=Baaleninema simplex TaxID=2862350 RepID=UPI00068910C4|nr:adenosylcobinamide-phosphate synthase CbiB [Baaleninema simplex]